MRKGERERGGGKEKKKKKKKEKTNSHFPCVATGEEEKARTRKVGKGE